MKIQFKVHDARHTTMSKVAVVDGVELPATIHAFLVEIHPLTGGGSTGLTWTKPSEIAEAEKIFKPGSIHTMEVS